jgi:tRNA A-37 threonylcarbamoyl transferase component Bud32
VSEQLPSSVSCVPFEAAGYRGNAERDVLEILRTDVLTDPEACVRAGTVLGQNRYRVTGRVELSDGRGVLTKWHRRKGPWEAIRARLRRNRAETEWHAGRYLHAVGINVPRSLAWGERRLGLVKRESFSVAAFIEGLEEIARIERRQLLPGAERQRLRARCARILRVIHDHGFDHRDFHSGNLLVPWPATHPDPVYVVDLHRCWIARRVRPHARKRALTLYVQSFGLLASAADRMRMIKAYLGEDADRQTWRAWYATIERRRRRFERARWRSRRKRCLSPSTLFTPKVGAGSGYRVKKLGLDRLNEVLLEHDEALAAQDARVAKEGRKTAVTLHGDVVVKERRAPSAFHRLRDRMWPSRHRAGYVAAHSLWLRGVASMRPLAYVQRAGRIFSVFEDLSQLDRLDRFLMKVADSGRREWKLAWIRYTADWLASLHRRGIYHGDLKAVNVRVEDVDGRICLYLLDTDRVVIRFRPVSRRRRLKNLAQLAASIPRSFSRTDRLRWFRHYARATPYAAQEEEIARSVATLLAQKKLVVDEPFE